MAFVLTLSELARWVDGDIVRGEPDLVLTGMAALDGAAAGDVSFLGNEKYRGQFLESKAGAVIVPCGENGGDPAVALIAVENPTLAFGIVVRHFAEKTQSFSPGIHPGAHVDESAQLDVSRVKIHAGAVILANAKIGNGTEIGPNCVIGEFVVIGEDCRLMANTTVRERCVLGDRVILQPGAVIGSDGYGYELSSGRHVKIDQVGIVVIGDDVEIGANSTIDRARFGKTEIGEGTKIDNLVQIGHNVVIGKHCLIVAQSGIAGSSRIGNYVTVAAQVGVAGHLTVGDQAVLAARAGVAGSLPGGQIYSGKPAQPMREELKQQAHLRRLPKLIDRVKTLEDRLKQGG
ncbi:MAG: UDP-3-O-(3-hydroxymyristoyl)glucosamine N-acyltransferase [Luteolibacter sp.]